MQELAKLGKKSTQFGKPSANANEEKKHQLLVVTLDLL